MQDQPRQSGPKVTVLMSTYNRPMYVHQALESILRQSYGNIQAVLVRDGGMPVRPEIEGLLDDSRVTFIDRDVNRGLPYSFNEALSCSDGEYICYLGDDDMFYHNHVATLVEALETDDQYGAAYTDLYKVHCRIEQDGRRTALAKNVEISRDFDRNALLQFNHILHVSLMHRRDLLNKIGPCNEKLSVLIDWDLTRRLSFFTDFKHIHKITGQYYAAIPEYQDKCQRKSSLKQKNKNAYIMNHLTIQSTRPKKPWAKIEDTSIILLADRLDDQVAQLLREIWSHTFYPYRIYLPLCEEDLRKLVGNTIVPNIIGVPVSPQSSPAERLDAVLQCCDGDYVAVVPSSWRIRFDEVAWIEKSLYPLMRSENPTLAYELSGSDDQVWGAVFRNEQLRRARRFYGSLGIRQSVEAAGVTVRQPAMEEWPFQMENLLTNAQIFEREGAWLEAANLLEQIPQVYDNELWMQTRRANALYHGAEYARAAEVVSRINSKRPTPATLLIEARSRRKLDDCTSAIRLLELAEDILEGRELTYA